MSRGATTRNGSSDRKEIVEVNILIHSKHSTRRQCPQVASIILFVSYSSRLIDLWGAKVIVARAGVVSGENEARRRIAEEEEVKNKERDESEFKW